MNQRASGDEARTAQEFVRARLEARPLERFPGEVPADRATAYRIQDAAIALWPEPIAGWKSTMIIPERYGPDYAGKRLAGPAFPSKIRRAASGDTVDCPLIEGGDSGVEAEIVICVARDAPPDKVDWTVDEAAEMVGQFCIGAEIACSPLPLLGSFGASAIAADLGENFGIIIGPEIPDWQTLDEVRVRVLVDDNLEAEGAISVRSGALDAFAFLLSECAQRGYPLRAGAAITTGTATTLHRLNTGQTARLVFEGLGEIVCRSVRATPHPKA